MTNSSNPYIQLDDFWPYHVVFLADQISRHTLRAAKSRANLNLSQWRVLAAVADDPGLTAAAVTTLTPMDKTIVSRAVSSLIDLGLIAKSAQSGDKRRLSLTLTAQGHEIYADIASHLNETLINALEADHDSAVFVKMIKSYSAAMKEAADLSVKPADVETD